LGTSHFVYFPPAGSCHDGFPKRQPDLPPLWIFFPTCGQSTGLFFFLSQRQAEFSFLPPLGPFFLSTGPPFFFPWGGKIPAFLFPASFFSPQPKTTDGFPSPFSEESTIPFFLGFLFFFPSLLELLFPRYCRAAWSVFSSPSPLDPPPASSPRDYAPFLFSSYRSATVGFSFWIPPF